MEMSMEHSWKAIDRGKRKYWEENLSQWHLVLRLFHVLRTEMNLTSYCKGNTAYVRRPTVEGYKGKQ